MPDPLDSALFAFEEVQPDLEYVPLAARRALDLAGIRLSLDGWRSLSFDDRRGLALAGAPEDVDVERVAALTSRARPSPSRIAPAADPDPYEAPDALTRALGPERPVDARRWAALRSLERYALMHGYRRAVTKGTTEQLESIYETLLGAGRPSARPPPPSSRDVPSSHDLPSRREVPSSREGGGVSSTPGSPRDGAGRAAVTDVPSSPRSPQPAPGAYSIATPNSVRGAAIGVMRPRTSTAASSHKGASSHRSPPTEPAITLSPRGAPAEAFRRVGSHVDDAGQVHMVGVGDKPATARRAVARALVRMKPETAALVVSGAAGKGEVLATARLAGIMAAKRTPEIVPLCHHVALTRVAIDLEIDAGAGRVRITSTAEAVDRTGVEMEAMVAASVAGLTIYDMLKGVDRDIELESVYLVEKSGGKTGHYIRAERGT